jgi:hypothetical protein
MQNQQEYAAMTMTMWMVLALVIREIFTLIFVIDQSEKKKRRDDRDGVKADDIRRNPGLLDKSQQAAELQISEADEKSQPSRFKPDAKENQRSATGQ